MRNWLLGSVVAALLVGGVSAGAPLAGAAPAPPMMGMGGGDKPSPNTLKLLKRVDQLQAAYKKKPSAPLKNQLADAWYQYGHARMFDNALSPRQKYRPALFAFRNALKLNPHHKKAEDEKNAIENVYRSMGMPIPQQ